jgi:hypothetical protein
MKETRTLIACIWSQRRSRHPQNIQFIDVTTGSGVEYTGESYGAAWGDYNGDGLPDLHVNHHRNADGLYLNLGNGAFENNATPWTSGSNSRPGYARRYLGGFRQRRRSGPDRGLRIQVSDPVPGQ